MHRRVPKVPARTKKGKKEIGSLSPQKVKDDSDFGQRENKSSWEGNRRLKACLVSLLFLSKGVLQTIESFCEIQKRGREEEERKKGEPGRVPRHRSRPGISLAPGRRREKENRTIISRVNARAYFTHNSKRARERERGEDFINLDPVPKKTLKS